MSANKKNSEPAAAEEKKKVVPEYTGIKMDKALYRKARRKAKDKHQSYSEYVRQLIVSDLVS